jgi:AbrB family looped-hinge helix DNA binding protein
VSKVGERGQVTIDKAIRAALGVGAGDLAIQRLEGQRVIIEFVPAFHDRSLSGALKGKVRRVPPDERWSTLRDAARDTPDPDRSSA